MHINIGVALNPNFNEFLVIECSMSLNMHFIQSLLEFLIFIIEVQKYLLFIYLV